MWYQEEWQPLNEVSVRKVVKKKRPVNNVLDSLEWFQNPGGPKVALVSNFLKQLGKQTGNCGKHARLWNKTLEEDGFEVLFERLRFKAGSKPWVGTRGLFKEVCKWL